MLITGARAPLIRRKLGINSVCRDPRLRGDHVNIDASQYRCLLRAGRAGLHAVTECCLIAIKARVSLDKV